ELQREFEVKSVLGNHDEAFLYNMPISGSGLESRRAHLKLRNSDLSFFNDLPQFLIDERERIIAVHGGPLDPERIMPQGLGASARWLYQRTWQRIADVSFFDFSGFHYTPEMAFEHVRRENFLILCGHQHLEAAYSGILKDFWMVEDILDDVNLEMREYAGFDLELKSIRRERGFSYLIRLGIAGPEGYRYLGWNRAHFGLISKERVYLLSFRLP
ncbi:MAG: metallophosphoesterase, partial [Candidatus Methanofastidiosia archaeon]